MRGRLAHAVAAVAVFGGSLLISAGAGPSAGAASSLDQGWWWKGDPGAAAPTPGGTPTVTLPATAPAAPPPPNAGDGLVVAANVDGPIAIAAVQAALDESETMPAITLDVADNGDVNGAGAHLLACRTSSSWSGASGGRWDQRPAASCETTGEGGSVAGIRSSDGKTWTFPVAPLVSDGQINVVIVSTADANGLTQPFQIVFKRPSASAIHTDTGTGEAPAGGAGDAGAGDFTASDASAAQDTGFSSAGSSALGSSSSSFAPATPSTPSGAGTTAPSRATTTKPQVNLQQQASPNLKARPASTSSDARTLGFAVLLAGAAAAWFTTRQKLPTPHSLSRVAARHPVGTSPERLDPTPGGLGRFSRPRTGPPPKLF